MDVLTAHDASPFLGPRSTGAFHGFDSDFPSIDLDTPGSPGLSDSKGTLVELAHEARSWEPGVSLDGKFKLDLCAFAESTEPDSCSFKSPGIPRLETVQRIPADEAPRPRKRARLDSLGTLAESDLLGVLNSAYDSLAASLANSIASSLPPLGLHVPMVPPPTPPTTAPAPTSSRRRGAGAGAGAGSSHSGKRKHPNPNVSATTNGGLTETSGVRRIGAYTVEERRARVARFHIKRKQRVWNHKVKYDCRKKLADNRPRIKGRFVRRCDVDAYLAAKAAAEAKAAKAAKSGKSSKGSKGSK